MLSFIAQPPMRRRARRSKRTILAIAAGREGQWRRCTRSSSVGRRLDRIAPPSSPRRRRRRSSRSRCGKSPPRATPARAPRARCLRLCDADTLISSDVVAGLVRAMADGAVGRRRRGRSTSPPRAGSGSRCRSASGWHGGCASPAAVSCSARAFDFAGGRRFDETLFASEEIRLADFCARAARS